MRIICEKNKGYSWNHYQGTHCRGYFQVDNDKTYVGEKAVKLLASIESYREFISFLRGRVYGSFSIIIEKQDEVWAAVDIARSMPIYYSSNLKCMSDKVDRIIESEKTNVGDVDEYNSLEMYTTSFVSGDRTVLRNIKQIDIGSCICIKDGKIMSDVYYCHISNNLETSREEAIDTLRLTTNGVLNRLRGVIGNRTIVISLSGGYDSRYLACSLKENGYDDVICYSYGRHDSFEPRQSKRVADALGYKWYCIYYDEIPKDFLVSESIQEYYDYSRNYDYISYIQNYYAFKELCDRGMIPENSVVLTGLCNDMPTGFYTPEYSEIEKYGFTEQGCARYIFDTIFIKFILDGDAQKRFIEQIKEDMRKRGLTVYDYESFIKASDCLNTGYSHSRCFLHMNDVHEFFGHEWIIPCWDRDLLDFWYSLPSKFRIRQNLYEEYITRYIGRKYSVGEKKTIRVISKSHILGILIRRLGSLLVKPLLTLGIPIRRKTDINNFAPQEVSIYKKISNKQAIKPKYAALTLMLTVYFLDNRHGRSWYKKVKKYIIK